MRLRLCSSSDLLWTYWWTQFHDSMTFLKPLIEWISCSKIIPYHLHLIKSGLSTLLFEQDCKIVLASKNPELRMMSVMWVDQFDSTRRVAQLVTSHLLTEDLMELWGTYFNSALLILLFLFFCTLIPTFCFSHFFFSSFSILFCKLLYFVKNCRVDWVLAYFISPRTRMSDLILFCSVVYTVIFVLWSQEIHHSAASCRDSSVASVFILY